ncbi:hypothetical protein MPDQ_001618 [Monascus purpureus]|uniref:Major facilitator superfamily (MFS) profile domain-containing protein n=1 Tax=Monascus purpureus TaxID=5098 RepID=A0A507QP38_MONPU|nr:hypothetical protein MPDQ_001618 [Monascus purpureus]BDD57695.1 hypothetical protein MAP00_003041 [Monascus purpureus]
MSFHPDLFTATRGQTFTYLFAVCPFSIAFLVFINSSISFVVTDLIGLHDGEGDAVGTLGFADELLALAACPIWGLLSDRIGVRYVCTVGYAIVALSLALFVQAKNVYPQLLLGRLLFSLGGAAVSTMVTAVLPAVTDRTVSARTPRTSNLSTSPHRDNVSSQEESRETTRSPSSRLAGFVGTCAGFGALISLALFLPLPARFEKAGISPSKAIQLSYYFVGGVALLISVWCFFGLRNLPGEERKGWRSLLPNSESQLPDTVRDNQSWPVGKTAHLPYWKQFSTAVTLGFQNRNIGLGYVGGFVARASSVGISLFIPLFVNHFYRASGLCNNDPGSAPGSGLGDIKRSCPKAYILASILTGVSQLVALFTAPAFGFLSVKSRRYHLPLLSAALAGVFGYTGFALLPDPRFNGADGNPGVFVVMALIGVSQIGAIVCSLAVLSNGILTVGLTGASLKGNCRSESNGQGNPVGEYPRPSGDRESGEQQPLLGASAGYKQQQLSHLKGAIAGVYSLYGGAGILVLTKLGGFLFDMVTPDVPFYIMAGFNGILLLAGIVCGLVGRSNLVPN